MGIPLALQTFVNLIQGKSVLILTDNTTAMYYLNKWGGFKAWLMCKEVMCI